MNKIKQDNQIDQLNEQKLKMVYKGKDPSRGNQHILDFIALDNWETSSLEPQRNESDKLKVEILNQESDIGAIYIIFRYLLNKKNIWTIFNLYSQHRACSTASVYRR